MKSPLKILVSSALITEDAKDDFLNFAEKGQKCFEEFIHDRLLPTSTLSFGLNEKAQAEDLLSDWMEKIKSLCGRQGDQVVRGA